MPRLRRSPPLFESDVRIPHERCAEVPVSRTWEQECSREEADASPGHGSWVDEAPEARLCRP